LEYSGLRLLQSADLRTKTCILIESE
jgi:hypothetical protein